MKRMFLSLFLALLTTTPSVVYADRCIENRKYANLFTIDKLGPQTQDHVVITDDVALFK